MADDPTGPFIDTGAPLIDWKPEGINRGAEIDPDVFHDPVSGKDYLYWGNGYAAVAELNKDMLSIRKETLKLLNPTHFREGLYVFYRKGIYYFCGLKMTRDMKIIECVMECPRLLSARLRYRRII